MVGQDYTDNLPERSCTLNSEIVDRGNCDRAVYVYIRDNYTMQLPLAHGAVEEIVYPERDHK